MWTYEIATCQGSVECFTVIAPSADTHGVDVQVAVSHTWKLPSLKEESDGVGV